MSNDRSTADPVFLAFGSNIGDAKTIFNQAYSLLEEHCQHIAHSSLYLTTPYGYKDQNDFTNAAFEVRTNLSPLDLLSLTQRVEVQCGKKTPFKNGPRSLDIDILFYGSRVVTDAHLKIPHPHLHDRDFVLLPMAEIAPTFRHPQTDLNMQEHLEALTTHYHTGKKAPWR
jgi:2-amino-4-hydroxy-6-hydroxymethyldihydropteridine diphosphokinase